MTNIERLRVKKCHYCGRKQSSLSWGLKDKKGKLICFHRGYVGFCNDLSKA